jgi:hypothetical protein
LLYEEKKKKKSHMEEQQKEVSTKSQEKEEQNRMNEEVVGRCVEAKWSSDSDAETNRNRTAGKQRSVIAVRKDKTRIT